MSWASRRRTAYAGAVIIIFAAIVFIPVYKFLSRPATCADGIQNQGETAIDKGGPCPILDERLLSDATVLWARSFKVRDGSYSTVAYIENPNPSAGARNVEYTIGLYDSQNILITEWSGTTSIMPGAVTPVFESGFDTGKRDVARTYMELSPDVIWEKMGNPATVVQIGNKKLSGTDRMPRLEATVENTSTRTISDAGFVAVLFSPAGNARAASRTELASIKPGMPQEIVFTWPEPFVGTVGRIDILPLMEPMSGENTP